MRYVQRWPNVRYILNTYNTDRSRQPRADPVLYHCLALQLHSTRHTLDYFITNTQQSHLCHVHKGIAWCSGGGSASGGGGVVRVQPRQAALAAPAPGSAGLALVVAGLAAGRGARALRPQAGVARLLGQQRLLCLDHRVEQALLYLNTTKQLLYTNIMKYKPAS